MQLNHDTPPYIIKVSCVIFDRTVVRSLYGVQSMSVYLHVILVYSAAIVDQGLVANSTANLFPPFFLIPRRTTSAFAAHASLIQTVWHVDAAVHASWSIHAWDDL